MNDPTNTALDLVAGGLPLGHDRDGTPRGEDGEEASLDATLLMSDEEWLEHALGDLHSSTWTVPNVEL